MDGLDCSEIFIGQIEKNLFRIEAEYFQKKYQAAEKILNDYNIIEEYKKKIECGPFGSNLLDSEYKDSGILVVRPFNLIDCSIENERLVYISDETIKQNNLKIYPKGALLFSRVGDIKVGYANKDNYTISPNIIITDFGDEKLSKYASVFYNTYYGRIQIERQLKVAAQPTISTEIISKLKFPIFCKLLEKVASIIDVTERKFSKSQDLYLEAEKILQKNIYLDHIKTANHSTKKLSESFLNSGRLDAEYYHPKYDKLFSLLKQYKCKKLGGSNGLTNAKKSIEPGSEAYQKIGVPFVRVSDMTKYEIFPPEIHISHETVKDIASLYPSKNTILFSKDGSVGIAYKLEKDENFVTSSALLHLTIKDESEILPDYLTLVLNSQIVQMQAEHDSNGAIISHWKPSEIENVIIPVLDMSIQKQIQAKVQESFELRRQSKQLLEYAKQGVEMAIEQGEGAALIWLKERLGE